MGARTKEDYINRKFGMLTVMEKIIIDNHTYWKCICDCGNEKTVKHYHLKRGYVKSCGCRGTFKNAIQKKLEKYCVNNTYIPTLSNERKINSNNTSGYRGVSYRKDRNKYRAYIKFQGKDIFLGHYDNIDDAIKARKDAEKEYFGEFAPQIHLYEQYGIKEN